jgi:hypothetical protein
LVHRSNDFNWAPHGTTTYVDVPSAQWEEKLRNRNSPKRVFWNGIMNAHQRAHPVRYLEDFEPGQRFASRRRRIDLERVKSLARSSTHSHFISMKTPRGTRSSRDSLQAAGTLRR